MRKICGEVPAEHSDYIALGSYLNALESIKDFDGHIITTHDRLLPSDPEQQITGKQGSHN